MQSQSPDQSLGFIPNTLLFQPTFTSTEDLPMESDSDYHSADGGDNDPAVRMVIEKTENQTLDARRAIGMAHATVSS